MFYHSSLLISHIKGAHGTCHSDYIERHGPCETLIGYHKCRLCGARVKQNYQAVVSHMGSVHENMDPLEYGKMFGLHGNV